MNKLRVDVQTAKEDVQTEETSSRTFSLLSPVAQPLKRTSKKPMRRYEDYHEEKGKDTKISKIFQLSVTALSFLAFGGYLLTLIITAIRQNAGNAGNGNVIVFSVSEFTRSSSEIEKPSPFTQSRYKNCSGFRICRVCKATFVQKETSIHQRTRLRSCIME